MAKRLSADKQEHLSVPPPAPIEDHPAKPNGPEPNGANGAGIPSPNAGDGLDEFARYAVDDEVTSQAAGAAFCSVGPPKKLHFFRAHTDPGMYRVLHFLVVEEDTKKRTYLVRNDLTSLPEFEGKTKIARTSPWVNEHGAIGIWLVSIEHDENSWVRSAMNVIEEAKREWVCASAVKKTGQYATVRSKRDRGEPKWPDLDFSGWMKLAFPPDMRIDSPDHQIAKFLRGE